jgi:protein SCO1/2
VASAIAFISMVSRVAALVVVLAVAVVSCSATGQATSDSTFDEIASRELPTSSDIGQSVGVVSLPDVSNDDVPFFFQASDGELLVVYFGFTFCPDICPTTLADLKSVLGDLGDDAVSVDVAMITVDPERDSAETLVDYVQWFIPDAHALRTDDRAELEEAGDAFGAEFSVVNTSDGGVEVLHTAYLYGVDDTGRIVATWPFGAELDDIATDVRFLLGG